MVVVEELPEGPLVNCLDCLQSGPALEKGIDEIGIEWLKPCQDLWKICLEAARQPVQQPGLIIDQLPLLLHEQLQGAGCRIIRDPRAKLVPMLLKEFQGQLCIGGIVLSSARCEGFAKFCQGAGIHRIQDEKGIFQQDID
jgi:hypothetical protein